MLCACYLWKKTVLFTPVSRGERWDKIPTHPGYPDMIVITSPIHKKTYFSRKTYTFPEKSFLEKPQKHRHNSWICLMGETHTGILYWKKNESGAQGEKQKLTDQMWKPIRQQCNKYSYISFTHLCSSPLGPYCSRSRRSCCRSLAWAPVMHLSQPVVVEAFPWAVEIVPRVIPTSCHFLQQQLKSFLELLHLCCSHHVARQ